MLTNNLNTSATTNGIDLSFFQRQLLYILFFFIPWFVIPLPWDPTEQIKVTAFIVLSSLIILLEVIKWIWGGKVEIGKSLYDKVFFLLLLSFLISSVFALDKWTAFWGFDGRFGTGLLSITILLTLFFVARGCLNNSKYILKAIEMVTFGISILLILSILSLFKVDVYSWIPVIKNFFVAGLPLTFHFKEILLLSVVLVLMSAYLIIVYLREKRPQNVLIPFVSIILAFVSIPLFSINQGILLPIFILLSVLFTSLLLFIKLEKNLKFIPTLLSVLVIISTIFAIGFQYESFKNSILGNSFNVVAPVSLTSDISWYVSSQVIVENVFRSLVGIGNESYAIAYNLFKPAVQSTISLSNISFVSSSSELFTTLANRGMIGVVIWIILGVVLIKVFINDIASSDGETSIPLLLLQISTIVLFLGSLFVHFSFLLYFIFTVSVLFSLIVRNIYKRNNEQFILKFWAVNVGGVSQNVSKTINSVNWFITGIAIVVVFAGFVGLGYRFLSTVYLAKAEAYAVEEANKYSKEEDITLDVREDYFSKLMSYYAMSLKYDSTNPVANRKGATTAIETMNVLSERYEKASEEEKISILSEITVWKNTAIDLSREAVSTSAFTYSNWYVRSSVYIGFLTIGLSDYSEDALAALQTAVSLNPLDFESYYRAGQIYMIKEDYEKALAAFDTGLRINGQHVPSLILSARILSEQGEQKAAISYLEAAKKIMEVNKLEDDPIYKSVLESLDEIKSDTDSSSSDDKSMQKLDEENLTDDLSPKSN